MPVDTAEIELRLPTDPELRVIRLVAEGLTNIQIAAALCVVEDTVKGHLRRMFAVWPVGTRMGLVRFAVQRGWLACPNCGPGRASAVVLMSAANSLRRHAASLDSLVAQVKDGGDDRG